jgi:hypothetical protein
MLTIRGGSATFDELKTNLDQIWGIQQASGYGPLIPKRYGELLNMTEGGFLIPPFHYKAEDRCFDILSIKYATSASIHENLNALPRCWLVGNVTRSTPKQILRGIKTSVLNSSERFNPLETALIEESPPPTWKNQSAPDKGTQQLNAQGEFKEKLDSRAGGTDSKNCQIISLTDKEVILETDSTKPSFLVVSEIYYPGWKATIDNRPAEIYKTDYVLRGLFVDKGKHRIIFSFEPTRLKPALFLALVAILLIILSAFFIDRKVGKTDVE